MAHVEMPLVSVPASLLGERFDIAARKSRQLHWTYRQLMPAFPGELLQFCNWVTVLFHRSDRGWETVAVTAMEATRSPAIGGGHTWRAPDLPFTQRLLPFVRTTGRATWTVDEALLCTASEPGMSFLDGSGQPSKGFNFLRRQMSRLESDMAAVGRNIQELVDRSLVLPLPILFELDHFEHDVAGLYAVDADLMARLDTGTLARLSDGHPLSPLDLAVASLVSMRYLAGRHRPAGQRSLDAALAQSTRQAAMMPWPTSPSFAAGAPAKPAHQYIIDDSPILSFALSFADPAEDGRQAPDD